MKLRNIIATSSLILAGAGIAHAADIVLECQACPSGTYTDGTSGVCSQCPSGTYSTGGAESCSACSGPTYSSWFTTISYKDCTGPFWYVWRTEKVTPTCGNATRTKTIYCTKAGSTSSTANPSSSDESGIAGTCGAGRTCTSGNCVACLAGYYKSSSGNGACTSCSAGTYSSAGSSSCTSCPAGTYSSAGSSSCTSCSNKPTNSYYTTSNSCNWQCDNGYDKVQKIRYHYGNLIGTNPHYEPVRSNYGADVDIIGNPECEKPITYSYCDGGSVSSSNRVITVHQNAYAAESRAYKGSRCNAYGGCCIGTVTSCYAVIEDRVVTSGQTNISIFKPNCSGSIVKNGDYF